MGAQKKNKKIVYIAHPISGDLRNNCLRVVQLVEAINRKYQLVLPFAPYIVDILALDNDKEEDKKRGMENNFELLRRDFIDEMWVFGDVISEGVSQEIEVANSQNIPVKFKDRKDYEYTTGN